MTPRGWSAEEIFARLTRENWTSWGNELPEVEPDVPEADEGDEE